MRTFCAPAVALLLAGVGGAVRAQDGAVSVQVGDETPPVDPMLWLYDPEAPARVWLDKPPIDPRDLRARPQAWGEVLTAHGVALEVDSRAVTIRGATLAEAWLAGDPIEYLVVTEMGKTHEALVLVRVQPSVLDACLRSLGLEPGAHTRFEEKDPLPPEADVLAGRISPWRVHPAHGPRMHMSVQWVDDDGRLRIHSLESLLIDVRTGQALPERGWIYTGSRTGTFRQGREVKQWFKADVEGDVVAIYLAGRDSCLFERAALDGLEDSYWLPNPEVLPPRGTPVTLRIWPTGEAVAPSAPLEGALLPPEEAEPAAPESEGKPADG